MADLDIREDISQIIISDDYRIFEADGGRGISLGVYEYEFLLTHEECTNLIKALKYAKERLLK